MTLPTIARYADSLRYDRERGVLLALDWAAYPDTRWAELGDAEAVARAIGSSAAAGWPAPYLAGYGLALAARAWAGRPSDARRGMLIQAGEWLRRARPADRRLSAMVEQGLARADAALLAGADGEAAALSFVADAIGRADRVAERCGRIAAGLLDDGDRLLTYGFAGPALAWMLFHAREREGKRLQLYITHHAADATRDQLVARLASEIGVPVTMPDDLPNEQFSLLVCGAERIAIDGGVAGEPGLAPALDLARSRGIPRYVLGYDGPDPAAPSGADLAAGQSDLVAPELISAIVPSRGISRPEMIARHLGDGDAPLDVISLSPS